MPEKVTTLAKLMSFETRSGSTRFVAKDADGEEYTTFREKIAEAARPLESQRVRIEFHTEERGEYTNIYLDGIEPAPVQGGSPSEGGGTPEERDAEEVAWKTAVDAAPILTSEDDREAEMDPDELYEKLKPFKDRVAEDLEAEEGSGG